MKDLNTRALEILRGVDMPQTDINISAMEILRPDGELNKKVEEVAEKRAGSNLKSRAAVAGIKLPETNDTMEKGLIGRIGERLEGRSENLAETMLAAQRGEQSPLSTFTQVVGENIGGIVDVSGELFTSALQTISEGLIGESNTEAIKKNIDEKIKGALEIKDPMTGISLGEAIEGITREYQKLPPEDKRNLRAAGGLASFATEIAGLKPAKKAVSGITQKVSDLGTATKQKTGQLVEKVAGIKRPRTASAEIAELIAEPENAAGARKALQQGRIIQGETFVSESLLGRKPGQIAPSKKIERAQEVITAGIEDGAIKTTKNPQEFFTGIKKMGTDRAKQLKPKLQAIGLTDQQKTDAFSFAEDLRKEFLDSKFPETVLTPKEKRALQGVIDDMSKVENSNDLWQARINFDKAVPDRVKQATENAASDTLQSQAFWRETRNDMNSGLEKIANDFDIDIRTDFDDMSSLFEAQQNMIAKAPKLLKAKAGALGKGELKKLLGKIGLGIIGTKILLD